MSQHYFQDPETAQYGNNLEEYDNPMIKTPSSIKANGRGQHPRRLGSASGPHPQGSSLSSSDNNSDTTYAESDINNSLRARMAAFDNGKYILSILRWKFCLLYKCMHV